MNILEEKSGKLREEQCKNCQLEFYLDNVKLKPLSFATDAGIFKDKWLWISFSLHVTWKHICPGSFQKHKVFSGFSSNNKSLLITLIHTELSSSFIPEWAYFTQHKKGRTRFAGKHVLFEWLKAKAEQSSWAIFHPTGLCWACRVQEYHSTVMHIPSYRYMMIFYPLYIVKTSEMCHL